MKQYFGHTLIKFLIIDNSAMFIEVISFYHFNIDMINSMKTVCNLVILFFSHYCSDKNNF